MTNKFIIEGGNSLQGSIVPQGNKNEALPILCASVLNAQGVVIHNIPQIEDIKNLIKILEFLGAKTSKINGDSSLKIEFPEIITSKLPEDLTASLRGAVTLIGPLLARTGEVYMPRPGGDKIGRRRIDTHLLAMKALGAEIKVEADGYLIRAKKLKGASILLDEASVTGTENAVAAAAVAEGKTIIENAASEPHVQGVCRFLQSMGVKIEGIGSNVLTIEGIGSFENLKAAEHTIGPDYLEIGSFISMAALTNGEIKIKDVNERDLRMILMGFSRLGIETKYEYAEGKTNLIVPKNQSLKVQTDVHNQIPKIDDAPWPAFPADLVSIILVTATQCSGDILIHEKLFESRLFFTDKLISMGARIVLCDPHRAVVMGPAKLYGQKLTSPDIRAGMALVIAALCAEGESEIQNIIQIDRGYERIDERLRELGAKINRA